MPDTLLCDISEHQATPLDDSYPYRAIIIRSNDGTYRDKRFRQNYAWCVDALNRGKLDFFGVYFVYWPNWQAGEATFWSQVGGELDPRAFVMIDMESWAVGGVPKISGDQSAGANALRESLIAKLGGNRKRVIAYGNQGDLDSLWPDRGDALVNVANYIRLPNVPNMLLHQFTSSASVPPFPGRVDLNTANGHDVPSLMNALGLDTDALEAQGDGQPIDSAADLGGGITQEETEMKLIGATDGFEQVVAGGVYAFTGFTCEYIGDPGILDALVLSHGEPVSMIGADVFRHIQQADANKAALLTGLAVQ